MTNPTPSTSKEVKPTEEQKHPIICHFCSRIGWVASKVNLKDKFICPICESQGMKLK